MEELLRDFNISPNADITVIKEELELCIRETMEEYNNIMFIKNKSEQENQIENELRSKLDRLENALNMVNRIIKSAYSGLNAYKSVDIEINENKENIEYFNTYQDYSEKQSVDETYLKDTVIIYDECLRSAENGDADAQYKLAHMYYSGENAPKNKNRALYWLQKSAENGHMIGQYELGIMFYSGNDVSQDREEGLKWLKKSAENGYGSAILELIKIAVCQEDFDELHSWLSRCDQGLKSKLSYEIVKKIIHIYYKEDFVEDDNDGFYDWCIKIAEDDNVDENLRGITEYFLGRMYQEGKRVKQNIEESIKWYQKAVEHKENKSLKVLGQIYYAAGPYQDYKKALKYFEMVYDSFDDKEIAFIVGQMYEKGLGTTQNLTNAEKWYVYAASSEHNPSLYSFSYKNSKNGQALYALATLYLHSFNYRYFDVNDSNIINLLVRKSKMWSFAKLEVNASYIINLLVRAAEEGNISAQRELAIIGYKNPYVYINISVDSKEAFKWAKEAAENGDTDSQYLFALMHKEGYCTKVNIPEAEKWFFHAAKSGHTEAQKNLASILLCKSDTKSHLEAIQWLIMAAEKDDKEALNKLGEIYAAGRIIGRDYPTAICWLEKAGEYEPARINLGKVLLEAEMNEKNYKKAVEIFEEAEKSQDNSIRIDALYYMGQMHEMGKGYRINFQSAKRYYMEAAKANYGQAMFHLGRMYEKGLGVTIDVNDAKKWYLEAFENNAYEAAKKLGDLYFEGKLLEKNDKEALMWYLKAAEAGCTKAMIRLWEILEEKDWLEKAAVLHDTEAQCKLGYMYMQGDNTHDFKLARKWLEEAARLNNAEAQYYMALLYLYGMGVEKDMDTSLYWLIKSGGQGYRKALLKFVELHYIISVNEGRENKITEVDKTKYSDFQRELGKMFLNGSDKNDYIKAFTWLNMAAKHGDLIAGYYLGVMYEQGKATDRKPEKAFELILPAAEQGYVNAQNYLGYMYENGIGIDADMVKATDWYDKAAGHGYIPAIIRLAEIYNNQGEGSKALNLLCLAADMGDYPSQKRLIKYFEKTGDYDQLFNYRYKAAVSGDYAEQHELVLMYKKGQGIPMIYRSGSKGPRFQIPVF